MSKNRNLVNTVAVEGVLKVPTGTTAQRPESPVVGYVRYNTTLGFLEQYTVDGWQGIAPPPAITSVSPTTYNGEQGTQFTINGSNFDSTVTVKFITAQGTEHSAGVVSRISNSQLTATTPQDFTIANEPLKVKVINGSGLSYILDNAIDCGGSPTWNTTAGSVGSIYDNVSGSNTIVTLSASDPDAGATVSYAITSGSLPAGYTLNSSSGAISGTYSGGVVSNSTTYSFTVTATDNASNTSSRAFTITVNQSTETGNGAGLFSALSTSTNANVLTTMSNTNYLSNATNQGGCDGNWLDFNKSSGTFAMHTGHVVPGWWPTIGVVQVSSTPRVVNRFRWYKHANACGNIDIYGSNQSINSGNFTDTSLYTYLGRGNVGGYGSETDGTIKTIGFNSNGYGYKWYMIRIVDNSSSSIAYPSIGSQGGWAMYGCTFDKV